jgi:hypothetical protein
VLLCGFYFTFSRTIIAAWFGATTFVVAALYVRRISGAWRNIIIVRRRVREMLAVVAVVSVSFVALFWPQVEARVLLSTSDESVRLRVQYNNDALSTGAEHLGRVNWFGVGIGNFTTWLGRTNPMMPRALVQPTHNVFLLVYSEIGFMGLLVWFAFLVFVVRSAWHAYVTQPIIRIGVLAMLAALFLVALLDHFFWTLQQGRILWWAMLALAAGPGGRYDDAHAT